MPLALLARAVALFPWRSLRYLGLVVGALAGSVFRIRRSHVESSMRRAGLPRSPELARGMYASLGTAALEFLWMTGRRGAPLAVTLTPRAEAVVQRYALRDGNRGRGVVFATAHMGNWDLVGCALARELSLGALTKRLSVGWIDRFWQRERAARGIELFSGAGMFRRGLRALGRGANVAVIIDQAPERASAVTRAPFLGEQAFCDLTAAMLAARAGAPLVLALGYRNPDGTHSVDVPLVLDPPPRASRAWAEHATRQLSDALEVFIRDRPAQWLWLHRRWKDVPRAERGSRPARGLLSLPS